MSAPRDLAYRDVLARAVELASQGKVAAAVATCHDAIGIDEAGPLGHVLLSELFLSQDFHAEAIRSASKAIELDPACAPAYLTLGLAYDRRGGMWDQSILVWHELVEVVPEFVTAHVQLGEAFSAVQFEREAIDEWNRALELDPHDARAMYNLAVAALRSEGMATALPGFRRAGELDASQDDFFFSLVDLWDGAPFEDLSRVAPNRDSRLAAAYALASVEDYFRSMGLIKLVLAEAANDAEALALAGYLYLKQDSVNEAMAVSLRALAVATKTPAAVYVLGAAIATQPGLGLNAARVFEALAKAVPRHPMAHVLSAESLLALQRYSEAAEAYGRAVELDPTLVRARFGLAAALFVESEHAKARHEIHRAAYHDTRRQGQFWRLYDDYAKGRG